MKPIITLSVIIILIYIFYYHNSTPKENFQTSGSATPASTDPIDCLCRNSEDFLFYHKEVCAGKSVNSCTNEAYLLQNPKECRTLGFDPCKNLNYITKNIDECKALKFSP